MEKKSREMHAEIDFNTERLKSILYSFNSCKALGPSSISAEYLKKLINCQAFMNLLSDVFKILTNYPDLMFYVPELY